MFDISVILLYRVSEKYNFDVSVILLYRVSRKYNFDTSVIFLYRVSEKYNFDIYVILLYRVSEKYNFDISVILLNRVIAKSVFACWKLDISQSWIHNDNKFCFKWPSLASRQVSKRRQALQLCHLCKYSAMQHLQRCTRTFRWFFCSLHYTPVDVIDFLRKVSSQNSSVNKTGYTNDVYYQQHITYIGRL